MQEAVHYFRSEPGFSRLLALFKRKYQSLGRVGGTVTLSRFSEKELLAIADFFGRDAADLGANPIVSLKNFEQRLQKTRFEGLTLHNVLEAFFKEKVISNKERQAQKQDALKQFFITTADQNPVLRDWVSHVLDKSPDTRFVYTLAEQNRHLLKEMIGHVAKALDGLPANGKTERLPFFAQRITGDPHAFDVQTEQGKLLLHAIAVYKAIEEEEPVQMPAGSEGINDILQSVGILRDDLHNFVTCTGLLADTAEGIHPVWQEAARTQTVWHVPVRELTKTENIYPYHGRDVWIVENSGVCSTILDACPAAVMVCTHGQFKLATWLLLDRLVQNDVTLHYSGDFDPEGLGMAQRLVDRYPGHIHLWHMDLTSYMDAGPNKYIEKARLEKLNRITQPVLLQTAERMKLLKKASYQEALIKRLIGDMLPITF
ncbi:uncharacterized protein (TIGR02679 family) [Scopulibacillus darangshiensis]|uniref:Uncharacterized protein (TIGR02679 family) n=2 Tax=Scopulibacillus darangshiensis TaxID=442528 RepID=A0A4R2P7N1_9BACL|nr:uncharacterized protein (TIGR02679 family) [Scopulibacillus darangshiensis]